MMTLLSMSMTVGHAQANETPDIFDIIRQSEYLKAEAYEVPCEAVDDYPADRYLSLCYKMNPQTLTDIEHSGYVALSIGLELKKVFSDADWAVQADDVGIRNPYVAFFPKSKEGACAEELFMNLYESFSQFEGIDHGETDFPFQFAPTFNFHKALGSSCVG